MNRTRQDPEVLLDAAIAGVRDDVPADRLVNESRDRVWARIAAEARGLERTERTPASSPEHLRSCDDFRALFAEYRAGALPPARRMLVEDHIHECVACRKALHPVTAKLSPPKVVEMPKRQWRPVRWAIAAAALITAGSLSWYAYEKFTPSPDGSRMTVVAASGPVYKLLGDRMELLTNGATLAEGERLRTPSGSTAIVRLSDGSTIEVAERAEFRVGATRRDTTVYLDRGQIIVQAAKRDRGRLYVSSSDSRVAVKGTVFSVNRGLKGSRVSVIEGLVEVQYRGNQRDLSPGEQLSTDSSMGRVAVADEISWSRNYTQHLALLKQVVDLNQKLQQVKIAGLHYDSRLLDSVPAGTRVYVSVPNLGRAIADVERIVREQAAQSPELRSFLEKQFPEFEKLTKQMTQLGEFLGEEIVLAAQLDCKGFCGVIMAEVHRPGLREYIQQYAPAESKPLFLDAATVSQASAGRMNIVLANNRVYIGAEPHLVRAAVAGNTAFAQTAFGQTVADAYRRGTGLLVAADLESIIAQQRGAAGPFVNLGIDRVRHLVAEQRDVNGTTQNSAVLSFAGTRRGIASWLANPGPMGSLNFVSPDTQFASSFVVKDPSQMLRDVLTMSQTLNKSDVKMDEFERETGVQIEQLAAAMGGEVTFALDGPMIPTPSWKLIFEVRDPAAVQNAIEKAVAFAGKQAKVEMSKSALPNGGLEYHTIRVPNTPFGEMTYAFTDGYLLMTSSAGLLERTMSNRRAGVTLSRSHEFRSRLPRDQQAHFSGMVYQNAGELIRLVAKGASEAAGVTPEQKKSAEEIAEKIEPMLLAIYGEEDRIELASRGSALNLLTQGIAGNVLAGHAPDGTKRRRESYR